MRLLNQEPLRGHIIKTVDLLREPAGDKFRLMETILQNREEFTKRFHQALFVIHACAIEGIMTMEAKINALKKDKDGSKLALRHIRQIFRTINDSLVWVLLGKGPGV